MMCDQHGQETDETEKETDIVDPPEEPTADDNENGKADQDMELPTQALRWQEIKNVDAYGHSEFHSKRGLVAWWAKDGAWHVSIGGKWTGAQFPNAESAMVAVERDEKVPALREYIVNDSMGAPLKISWNEKTVQLVFDGPDYLLTFHGKEALQVLRFFNSIWL
jgi:hypothetical protein